MAELDFERGLEHLFAEAPYFSDADTFASRIEGRLNRGWTMRRWLIGAAGVAGGLIGASQLFLSNVAQRIGDASEGSNRLIHASLAQVKPGVGLLSLVQSDWVVVWVASGLAIVAMGFVLTRVIEEI